MQRNISLARPLVINSFITKELFLLVTIMLMLLAGAFYMAIYPYKMATSGDSFYLKTSIYAPFSERVKEQQARYEAKKYHIYHQNVLKFEEDKVNR